MTSRQPARQGKVPNPAELLFKFQIKDEIKAARIEATMAYIEYVEEPKTRQRR